MEPTFTTLYDTKTHECVCVGLHLRAIYHQMYCEAIHVPKSNNSFASNNLLVQFDGLKSRALCP